MRTALVVVGLGAIVFLGLSQITRVGERVPHADSPAFSTLLKDAIARLDGESQTQTFSGILYWRRYSGLMSLFASRWSTNRSVWGSNRRVWLPTRWAMQPR